MVKNTGYILLFSFLTLGFYYVMKNMDKIRFHFLDDTSMCFCGPNITQADPKGDLFLILLGTIIGVIMIIRKR